MNEATHADSGSDERGITGPLVLLALLGIGAALLWRRCDEKHRRGAGANAHASNRDASARKSGGASTGAEKILYLRITGNEIQETDHTGAVLRTLWNGAPGTDPPDFFLNMIIQGHTRINLYPSGDARTGIYLAIRRKAEQANIPLYETQWPE